MLNRIEAHLTSLLRPSELATIPSLTGPVLLLSGQQATGKSTAAKAVAGRLGGPAVGVGAVVRALAVQDGVSLAEMNRRLAADPAGDLRVDAAAVRAVIEGRAAVLEGRMAGWFGRWLRSRGAMTVRTALLICTPRERALRWVFREIGPEARLRAEAVLGPDEGFDLASMLRILATRGIEGAVALATRADEIADRDALDGARLRGLYGVGFDDPRAFDLILDTSHRVPADSADRLSALALGIAAA